MKKGQFNFVWIFAILAGLAILSLGIYGAIKGGETTETLQNSKTTKELETLLNPLQATTTDANYNTITLGTETRITTTCNAIGLGEQTIELQTKRNKNEWSNKGIPTRITNKYLYTEEEQTTTKLGILSLPFNNPWQSADLTIIISKEYCTKNTPKNIQTLLEGLNINMIHQEECKETDTTICFETKECDINIACEDKECKTGTITKEQETLHFKENLLLAGIIASPQNYDCNTERIITRTKLQTQLHLEQAKKQAERDCGITFNEELEQYKTTLEQTTTNTITQLEEQTNTLEQLNKNTRCNLW